MNVDIVTRCLALKLDTIRDAKESMGLIFVLSWIDDCAKEIFSRGI